MVVIETPARTHAETKIYGYTAHIHAVEVENVLKGDPLDGRRRMLIYATQQNGYWFTLTPAQGAIPLDNGMPLPFDTSAAQT